MLLPQIKKRLKSFILEEEGRISKSSLLKTGSVLFLSLLGSSSDVLGGCACGCACACACACAEGESSDTDESQSDLDSAAEAAAAAAGATGDEAAAAAAAANVGVFGSCGGCSGGGTESSGCP